jgi:hypothetical protein
MQIIIIRDSSSLVWLNSETLLGMTNIEHDRLADSESIANRCSSILGTRGQAMVRFSTILLSSVMGLTSSYTILHQHLQYRLTTNIISIGNYNLSSTIIIRHGKVRRIKLSQQAYPPHLPHKQVKPPPRLRPI